MVGESSDGEAKTCFRDDGNVVEPCGAVLS